MQCKVRLKDTGWEGDEWIDLAQVRGRWRVVVNSNVRCGKLAVSQRPVRHSPCKL